eukprot:COSAG05_NODE_13378_length_432_cov_3.039039_1_plen_25_part_10
MDLTVSGGAPAKWFDIRELEPAEQA